MRKMLRSRILFISAIIIGTWLICDNSKRGTLTVLNVARDTTFNVSTFNFVFPSVLKLKVRTNLNDSFKLGVLGKFRGGVLDTSLETDHYSRKFVVEYFHFKASHGNISIEYDLP